MKVVGSDIDVTTWLLHSFFFKKLKKRTVIVLKKMN